MKMMVFWVFSLAEQGADTLLRFQELCCKGSLIGVHLCVFWVRGTFKRP